MKILVVEDDLSLSDVLAFTLRRAGYQVIVAYDGAAALAAFRDQQPTLVVLDLNLPKVDGFTVCRQIRSQGATPIIILSVHSGDEAVVQALDLGADDYVVKPFSPSQLVARIRALARRVGIVVAAGALETTHLRLDRPRNVVQRRGADPIHLTPLEAKLLEALMLNVGEVLTSEALIATVWGVEGGDRTMLKQLVYRLRGKLEATSSDDPLIETIPGIGYSLNDS